MRPIVRGECPKDETGSDIEFKQYQEARGELINRIGECCSYCEMHLDSSLAIEHVRPKKPEGATSNITERELDWSNFLLSCSNCNSTKSNEDVVVDDYFWPDRDNTFRVLQYSEGGLIAPADSLNTDEKTKAEATIQLTGLDKHPLNDPEARDRRWKNRRETWDIAVESKKNLTDCDTPQMRRQIVLTAQAYWSIWMTVFQDDPDMLRRFIEAFPGTCKTCFDEQDNYKSIPRRN